ncbi:hypothetical protein CBR_g39595 [Chara braunii]|uniref:Small multi-drug export protein n=1 Tax=Chara braunii TaxID=69332 RepID=A0A388K185_CHABU|nr:hypothetical protein CBR_g39595 [Chara braunii]|eukprot:GBG63811.1 hypothetical protein CBR_g39595 [Chara braunii]
MAPAVVACRTALSSLQTANAGLSDGGIWTLGGIPRPLHRLSTWQCRSSGLSIRSVDRRRKKLHRVFTEVRDGGADGGDGGGDGGSTAAIANCNCSKQTGRRGGGGGGGSRDKRRRRMGRDERWRLGRGGSADAREYPQLCSSCCSCSSSSRSSDLFLTSEEQEEEEEKEEEEVVVIAQGAPSASPVVFLELQRRGLQKVPLRVPIKLLAKLALASLLAAPLLDYVFPKLASAAAQTLAQSSLGLRVAAALRSSNWPDSAIIFVISMLPVLELRGAVPVGYWMGLDPGVTIPVSIIGNMVPVPIILLYLGKLSSFLIEKSALAARFFDFLFEHTRAKAGPIAEFKWLGLMLFVAVPLPGTGAWSGAIAAHILGMPFWDAMSANFVGVVLAGLIMNMFCTVGLRQAIVVGIGLFILSSGIWSVLRLVRKKLGYGAGDKDATPAA